MNAPDHMRPSPREALSVSTPPVQYRIGTSLKLSRCPNCKLPADLWIDREDIETPFQVRCLTCGVCGPKCDCSDESAVPAWNKMADATHNKGGDCNHDIDIPIPAKFKEALEAARCEFAASDDDCEKCLSPIPDGDAVFSLADESDPVSDGDYVCEQCARYVLFLQNEVV